jgi:hypothetical protein
MVWWTLVSGKAMATRKAVTKKWVIIAPSPLHFLVITHEFGKQAVSIHI